MESILVVDDEKAICSSLRFALKDKYHVLTTDDQHEAYELIVKHPIHVVLLDWRLKEADGLEVLAKIKHLRNDIVVIMMTAYGTIPSTVEAMKRGAFYYITKPIDLDYLLTLIENGFEHYSLKNKNKKFLESLRENFEIQGLIGQSEEMKNIFSVIERIKDIDSNVLIYGESGTGKELVARSIHKLGKRADGPFEVVNCAAIPDTLLESEFFGFEKGAFTGATYSKSGKLIVANGGTLFLDEIGELPLHLQAKLLRVIQEKEVTPLGSNMVRKFNIRVIAATNRDLMEMVKNGTFREDLYFRLNVIPIYVPPLRIRKGDIPILIQYYLNDLARAMNKQGKELSQEVLKILHHYNYPGNIRELVNILEYAMAISQADVIQKKDLPNYIQLFASEGENHSTENPTELNEVEKERIAVKIGTTLKDIEKEVILATLEQQNGHRKKTALALGISERSLRDKLNSYK